MSIKLVTTGNGKFSTTGDQSDVIISYSTTESASPLSVSDLSGEIPTMNIVGIANSVQSVNNTHPSSKLLIDNSVTLTDSIRGSFTGKVNTLSVDAQSVTIDVYSKFDKLNVEKKMTPQTGTLKQAFESYFTQAGLVSGDFSVDASLSDTVSFPGWRDNIWNSLKMLCVATNTEIYFQDTIIYVKPRGSKTMVVEKVSNESFNIVLGQKAKTTKFTLGKTSTVTNGIVFSYISNDSPESVNNLEVKDVILKSKVSLTSINQPEYISTAFPAYTDYIQDKNLGTVPAVYPNGFYCFTDKNGNIITSDKLAGAKIVVSLGDEPDEIKVKMTGPNDDVSTPWTLQFEDRKPTLVLTGSGVLVRESTTAFDPGSAIGDSENEYSNNPFLTNYTYFYNTVYNTNQNVCGPVVSFSFGTDKIVEANNQEFGYLPGSIFSYNSSKYRVKSASYTYNEISVTAEQYVTFADFNTKWSGKTFAQFNSTMLDPTTYPNDFMKYSDLAIIPLMEPTA